VTVGNIALGGGGEEIFKQQRSLIFKSLRITRVYDKANDTLLYLAHARELQLGSGKMSLSAVPLTGVDVTWTNGKP
jgi:CreA protein